MSEIVDAYGLSCGVLVITEHDRHRAERAGKQWAEETKEKLGAGLEVWTRLVDTGLDVEGVKENAELFGMALASLEEGKLRDCLLMHACEGTLEKLGENASPDYSEETFLKLEHTAPDGEDIKTMCSLLAVCCAYANAEQGYPFALMAYLLWWTGKFHSAYEYVDKALERDLHNSLASLLSRVLGAGVMPPWLARECGGFHILALE